MTIRLVIKGTPEDAKKAAKEHHIPINTVRAGEHGCTTARAGEQFIKQVWDWYHERHQDATTKGYPVGTLIVYRER
jgi:hypothetical protein